MPPSYRTGANAPCIFYLLPRSSPSRSTEIEFISFSLSKVRIDVEREPAGLLFPIRKVFEYVDVEWIRARRLQSNGGVGGAHQHTHVEHSALPLLHFASLSLLVRLRPTVIITNGLHLWLKVRSRVTKPWCPFRLSGSLCPAVLCIVLLVSSEMRCRLHRFDTIRRDFNNVKTQQTRPPPTSSTKTALIFAV